ncbi:mucin-like protein 1 isoform X1 [Trachypithecus francoisi]|uniref:mucin-like protein 1 isoform X1 n=1 Tax=Trachypithecus francoisi TaxID=54180 RepID=UPI00141B1560|nr:mucin-like protein 1 isoform X1 [Trachypithecus francoisi]
MKFLAVLVLLGVSTFLVSAQSPTTSAPADTYPASKSAPECHLFPAMTIFHFQPHVKQPVSMWTVSVLALVVMKPLKLKPLLLQPLQPPLLQPLQPPLLQPLRPPLLLPLQPPLLLPLLVKAF